MRAGRDRERPARRRDALAHRAYKTLAWLASRRIADDQRDARAVQARSRECSFEQRVERWRRRQGPWLDELHVAIAHLDRIRTRSVGEVDSHLRPWTVSLEQISCTTPGYVAGDAVGSWLRFFGPTPSD